MFSSCRRFILFMFLIYFLIFCFLEHFLLWGSTAGMFTVRSTFIKLQCKLQISFQVKYILFIYHKSQICLKGNPFNRGKCPIEGDYHQHISPIGISVYSNHTHFPHSMRVNAAWVCSTFKRCIYILSVSSSLCVSAGLLGWRAVQLSPTSPSSGSRPSGTPLWGRSRPFTLRTPTSTHTWTTSAHSTAAPPSLFCQPPGASAPQMVNKVKHTPTHKAWCLYTLAAQTHTQHTHMHICTQPPAEQKWLTKPQ